MRSSLWAKRPNVCKKTAAKLLIVVIRRIPPLMMGEASGPPPLVYISSLVVKIIWIIAVKDTLTYTIQGLGLGMDYKKQFLNVPGCSFWWGYSFHLFPGRWETFSILWLPYRCMYVRRIFSFSFTECKKKKRIKLLLLPAPSSNILRLL